MTLEIRAGRPADRAAQRLLRHEVFVVGQGVPVEVEQDGRDDGAEHVVAWRDGRLVGTGRMLLADGSATLGRMAVAEGERGRGTGALMLAHLEQRAGELGCRAVELHAQLRARRFYERAGYHATTGVYLEAGIEHVSMRKALPAVRPVRDDDSGALIALVGGCWSEYPGVELHVDEEEPWMRAPASSYERWGGRMWVVELDDDVVACCGMKPVGGSVVELKSMYVAARARRRGIARLLERLVVEEARRRGARRVELWSDTRFTDAHATYAALGYDRLPGERDLHDISQSREYPFAKQV